MQINRILFFCLLAFCLLFAGCSAPARALEPESTAAPSTAGHILEELAFLGDSTTAHMRQRAPLSPGNKLFVTKERYLNLDSKILSARLEDPNTGELLTISELMERHRPPYLLITLGVDFAVYYYRDRQETLRRCYEKLLDTITAASPETTIIIGAIFPVTAEAVAITNDMIDRANMTLASLAADRDLPYADNNTPLKEANSCLRAEYCSSADGIHLSEAGYRALFENLAKNAPTWRKT